MIGTTRSRVSHFMNKFQELGFIDYNGSMEVHSSLLSVVLHDQSQKQLRPSRAPPQALLIELETPPRSIARGE
jgi:hypothetical protein